MKQNFFKIIFIVVFFLFLVITFVYLQASDKHSTEIKYTNGQTISEKQEKLKEEDVKEETLEESEAAYNSWLDEREELIDTRLDFEKEISLVYIGEINTHAINSPDVFTTQLNPVQFSFNKDTKSLYFYNDKNIPRKEDNLMVLHDIHELEIMLEQRVFKSTNDVTFTMEDVELEGNPIFNPIYDEGRLFRESKASVKVINSKGDVEIIVDDEKHILKVNDSMSVVKKDKPTFINGFPNTKGIEFKSKLVFTNYGKWNSKNMTYVVNYGEMD